MISVLKISRIVCFVLLPVLLFSANDSIPLISTKDEPNLARLDSLWSNEQKAYQIIEDDTLVLNLWDSKTIVLSQLSQT